jgi:hypothetical protein
MGRYFLFCGDREYSAQYITILGMSVYTSGMKTNKAVQPKHCVICGRFFRPHRRVGARQKCCGQAECRRELRLQQQQQWRAKNEHYFKGRYSYVKRWRQENPGYQKQWRAKNGSEIQSELPHVTSTKSIRLDIRAERPVGEIQTLVVTLVTSGEALLITGAHVESG